jgi:hypothetical protein
MTHKPTTYTVPGARLQTTPGSDLLVKQSGLHTGPLLLLGLAAMSLGIFWLLQGGDRLLLGFAMVAVGGGLAAAPGVNGRVQVNLASRQLTYTSESLLRRPRQTTWTVPLTRVTSIGLRRNRYGKPSLVDLRLDDDTRLVLAFESRRGVEAEQVVEQLQPLIGANAPMFREALYLEEQPIAPEGSAREAVTAAEHDLLNRELRSWSLWLLVMAGLQFLAEGGFSAWGAVLAVVGLASFYFRAAPMLVVYGVTVAWAAVNNLLYADAAWKVFALLQVYWAVRLFGQFRRFRTLEQPAAAPTFGVGEAGPASVGAQRARLWFPWLALGLGVGSLVLFGGVVAAAFFNAAFLDHPTIWAALGILEPLAVHGGIFGFAAGLAAWLAGHPRRAAAALGCVAGAMTLLGEWGIGLIF